MGAKQQRARACEGTGFESTPELCTFSCSSLELRKGFKQKRGSSMATVWWARSEGTSERQRPQGPNLR